MSPQISTTSWLAVTAAPLSTLPLEGFKWLSPNGTCLPLTAVSLFYFSSPVSLSLHFSYCSLLRRFVIPHSANYRRRLSKEVCRFGARDDVMRRLKTRNRSGNARVRRSLYSSNEKRGPLISIFTAGSVCLSGQLGETEADFSG